MKEPIDDWEPVSEKCRPNSAWRPLKWGLIGAVSAVALAVLFSAIYGSIYGMASAFYGHHKPGLDGAYIYAIIMFFFGGLPIAGIGFMVGLVIGVVKSGLGKDG
jgi:hypothetical protein